jgi:ribosomal protein S14
MSSSARDHKRCRRCYGHISVVLRKSALARVLAAHGDVPGRHIFHQDLELDSGHVDQAAMIAAPQIEVAPLLEADARDPLRTH